MYKHILIPTDGSALATRAVEQGIRLARDLGARVTVLTVTEPFHVFSLDATQLEDTRPAYVRHTQEHAGRILDQAATLAREAGLEVGAIHREADNPDQAIVEAAAAGGCDLVVMGSHGRGAASALMLGSVTLKVLARSALPVLVLR